MTRENAHQFLPLIQALAEGKTIQIFNTVALAWQDQTQWRFDSEPHHYRIKPDAPKPTMIPLTPEDLPSPCWISWSDGGTPVSLVLSVSDHAIVLYDYRVSSLALRMMLLSELQREGCFYCSSNLDPWKRCEKEAK